jgi:CHAT domain-containing protein/tetratricopeptide (TPR) repeat protein
MRPRALAQTLLAATIVAVTLTPPADAQRGFGKGRDRPREQAPQEEPATGEYALDGPLAIEAVNRGEGRQALAYYERAAAQAEQEGNHVRAARAWHAATVVALRLGRYQKGIKSASRSIEFFKKANARELTQADLGAWASAYSHLGSAYRVVGDLAQATKMLEEGLELARTRMSGRHEGQAEGFLLNALATVAYTQRDFRTALARDTQAAQYFEGAQARLPPQVPERVRSNFRRWTASSFLGIGRAQLALGNPDEADAAFDRGLKYARLSGLREVEVNLLAGQGSLALSRQDWSKALAIYQQSIALSDQMKRITDHPYLYNGLARSLAGLGRTEEAFAAAREAVRYVEELRADLGDSALRRGFLEGKQGIYYYAVNLALQAQHPEEAFSLAERSRSRTFLDLLGSQTTLSKGRTRALVDEEVRLRARLAEAKAEAQEGSGSTESARARAQVEVLDRDYRAFLDRVRKENLEQASLMAVEPVTLPEIQALLPEGTTLLEYHVAENGVVVWIVERQRFKVVRVPGDRQSLVSQVRRFRGAITKLTAIGEVQSQAQTLYRRLLEPARADISGSRLVIVPHGPLHYLPFSALRSPAGRWVVEDFAVSTLPSASVLRYLADKGVGASTRALVMGNPDLGGDLALPWAEREARMVGQREREATVLVRGDATEAQAKKLLETVGLIHFATHGELKESDPLSSAILLVPGGGEDGRLEVREVFGLDLHARLVVLSACETGLGTLSRGDEIVGLQRAFLYAGTPAVVTTLRKVDERASYELVRAFYNRLAGAGPVEALRQAQIDTMATFPHPYSWAAFGLTGVPR